ncbi:hypothetical protein SELMODRAFT_79688 [Selaginella moellendorffii]|uniref:Membrin n=1 Tax=Selaginella moellendorffii TaxID=88036 RepID=D8QX85_SELML|nr:membrin-11 [Selaginella moellendorffii]XP_024517747.1 membrin-11 [Selaginella moellendorffii]EFJ10625.1 hypothetical protein SELMODRAFT_426969 [Selaginella moellendorffii]EFJ35366.1 hypothetical protein SELMODRAFT_79688 [Selaginella moellendorffii]|eukprot:XP_002963495.1 membrin-11 [Selaginella moellendorffii]
MSGGTLSDVYQQARVSLFKVRDGLERLERLECSTSSSSSSPRDGTLSGSEITQSVKRDLGQLQKYSEELDQLWRLQLQKSQRDLWKRKVEQVLEEADSLRLGLEKYLGRQHRRQIEAQERADLFRRMNGDSAQVLQIFDDEQQAMRSLQRSSNMLEEAMAAGVAVLSKYSVQRDRLKSAQRKALDILTTVGLSNAVLRVIEKRHRIDKWISYTGMIVTIVVVIAVWMWVR